MKITIVRTSTNTGSLTGELYVDNEFLCHTLELPYKNNQSYISSIPPGEYGAIIRYDKKDHWRMQLTGTGHRTGVQIHIGNYPKEIQGCILPGHRVLNAENKIEESSSAYNDLKLAFYGSSEPNNTPDKTIRIRIMYLPQAMSFRGKKHQLEYLENGKWKMIDGEKTVALKEKKREKNIIYLESGNERYELDFITGKLWKKNSDKKDSIEQLERDPHPLWSLAQDFSQVARSQSQEVARILNNTVILSQELDSKTGSGLVQGMKERLKINTASRTKIEQEANPYSITVGSYVGQLELTLKSTADILKQLDSAEENIKRELAQKLDEVLQPAALLYKDFQSGLQKLPAIIGDVEADVRAALDSVSTKTDDMVRSIDLLGNALQSGSFSNLPDAIRGASSSLGGLVQLVGSYAGLNSNLFSKSISKVFAEANKVMQTSIDIIGNINRLSDEFTAAVNLWKSPDDQRVVDAKNALETAINQSSLSAQQFGLTLSHIGQAGAAFSGILSLFGKTELASDVMAVADAAITIGTSIASLASGTLSGFSVAGPYGAIAGAALGVFGYFASKGKKSPEQAAAEQMQKLGQMIEQLGKHIDQRFDRIEKMLTAITEHFDQRFDRLEGILSNIHGQMHARFDRIENILGIIQRQVIEAFKSLAADVTSLQYKVDAIKLSIIDLRRITLIGFNDVLMQNYNEAKVKTFMRGPLSVNQVEQYAELFATTALATAASGTLSSVPDVELNRESLSEIPVEKMVNALAGYAHREFGLNAFLDLPNPAIFSEALLVMVNFLTRNPVAEIMPYIKDLINGTSEEYGLRERGDELRKFFVALRTSDVVFRGIIESYRKLTNQIFDRVSSILWGDDFYERNSRSRRLLSRYCSIPFLSARYYAAVSDSCCVGVTVKGEVFLYDYHVEKRIFNLSSVLQPKEVVAGICKLHGPYFAIPVNVDKEKTRVIIFNMDSRKTENILQLDGYANNSENINDDRDSLPQVLSSEKGLFAVVTRRKISSDKFDLGRLGIWDYLNNKRVEIWDYLSVKIVNHDGNVVSSLKLSLQVMDKALWMSKNVFFVFGNFDQRGFSQNKCLVIDYKNGGHFEVLNQGVGPYFNAVRFNNGKIAAFDFKNDLVIGSIFNVHGVVENNFQLEGCKPEYDIRCSQLKNNLLVCVYGEHQYCISLDVELRKPVRKFGIVVDPFTGEPLKGVFLIKEGEFVVASLGGISQLGSSLPASYDDLHILTASELISLHCNKNAVSMRDVLMPLFKYPDADLARRDNLEYQDRVDFFIEINKKIGELFKAAELMQLLTLLDDSYAIFYAFINLAFRQELLSDNQLIQLMQKAMVTSAIVKNIVAQSGNLYLFLEYACDALHALEDLILGRIEYEKSLPEHMRSSGYPALENALGALGEFSAVYFPREAPSNSSGSSNPEGYGLLLSGHSLFRSVPRNDSLPLAAPALLSTTVEAVRTGGGDPRFVI